MSGVELGAAVEDWFQAEELVAAFTLVLAAVEDEDGSIVAVVATSVVAVLEDLVLLLQPLRANPARMMVNNIVFFIGGLIALRLTTHARFGSPSPRIPEGAERGIGREKFRDGFCGR
jgi:hypothetical protein